MLIVFGVAVVLVVPSMALLYTLAQRSLIEETSSPTASALGEKGAMSSMADAPVDPVDDSGRR